MYPVLGPRRRVTGSRATGRSQDQMSYLASQGLGQGRPPSAKPRDLPNHLLNLPPCPSPQSCQFGLCGTSLTGCHVWKLSCSLGTQPGWECEALSEPSWSVECGEPRRVPEQLGRPGSRRRKDRAAARAWSSRHGTGSLFSGPLAPYQAWSQLRFDGQRGSKVCPRNVPRCETLWPGCPWASVRRLLPNEGRVLPTVFHTWIF